jgi:biopolymer transport protein TolR
MSQNVGLANKPYMNVTPLIDVLLVLLIIFMVAAPMRPHSFAAKLPAPPDERVLLSGDPTLVVTVQPDLTLKLNGLPDEMGTVDDPSKLNISLTSLFKQRKANRAYRTELASHFDLPEDYRVQKTVFIKAPRSIAYGQVTKVVDALKGAGADPIGLQLDSLN